MAFILAHFMKQMCPTNHPARVITIYCLLCCKHLAKHSHNFYPPAFMERIWWRGLLYLNKDCNTYN